MVILWTFRYGNGAFNVLKVKNSLISKIVK